MDVRLEPLSLDHAPDLLAFELTNRAFFAGVVGDRGEAYFQHFDDRLADLVAERAAGTTLPFVLLDDAGRIVGRVNISDLDSPEAVSYTHLDVYKRQGQHHGKPYRKRGFGGLFFSS